MNTQDNQEKTAIVTIPSLKQKDWEFLQSLRKKYDAKGYAFIEPHFTLLTANNQFSKKTLNENLNDDLFTQKKIHFSLRTAIFMPPLFEHTSWYVFLIPDQGFSELSALHQYIYQSGLQLEFYKKFPFIPHVTIGSFQHQEDCLQLVENINKNPFELSGSIEKVSLIEINKNFAKIFKQIMLRD